MKRLNILLTLLFVYVGLVLFSVHAQDDIAITSHGIAVLSANEYNTLAQKDWEGIPNKADAEFLDRFIKRYPNSELNPVAFTLRYNLVRVSLSIPEYNRFIETYPGTLAAQLAIHEVFQLYRLEDRVSGYMDFMRRYPNTPHALIAKMQVESLMFHLVTLVDRVADYDAFINTFPDAPQVPAAEARAVEVATEAEKGYTGDRDRRSRILLADFYDVLDKAENALRQEKDNIDVSRFYRIARRNGEVISKAYRETEARTEVRKEERDRQIIQELKGIRQTLEDNHKNLIETLKKEFEATRETLRQGFELLHKDNEDIKRGLKNLEDSMNVLHEDLIAVNQNLITIHKGITDVRQSINQTNRMLTVLHDDLDHVYGSLVKINQDMNVGFSEQRRAINNVASEVRGGFRLLHEDMQTQVQETREMRRENIEIAHRNILMQKSIQDTLISNHRENLKHREKTTKDIRETIRTSTEAQIRAQYDIAEVLVEAQYDSASLITGAIHEQTERQIYSTGQIINAVYDSSSQVVQAVNNVGQRMENLSRSGSSGGGGFDDFVVGIGASVADSFFPGSGAVVKTVAPVLLDTLSGERELDMDTVYDTGLDIMMNTAKSKYPEAAKDVETITKLARMEDEEAISEVKRITKDRLREHDDEVIKFMARKIR
ncbi:hypothetical protein FJZ31_18185 [Candidatus Poribacteria bacterium]|nr:hypothetical protein [Candidatus Poribacteria bacterium]